MQPVRSLPLVAAAVLLAGLVSPAPAHASITDADLTAVVDLHDDSVDDDDPATGCTVDPSPSGGETKTVTDNGRTISVADQHDATATGSDPEDTVALTGAASASTTVTPISATGGSVRFTTSLVASAVAHQTESQCSAHAVAASTAAGSFTLTAPMWVSVSVAGSGAAVAQVAVGPSGRQFFASSPGRGTVVATYRMSPGQIAFEASASLEAFPGMGGMKGSAAIGITLRPIGAAGAITGTGQRFAIPGARSCSANTVRVGLTKAVTKAKKVEIRVNGVRRVKLTGRIRPRTLAFAVPAVDPATVVATIIPKKGKRVTVTRSYLACS